MEEEVWGLLAARTFMEGQEMEEDKEEILFLLLLSLLNRRTTSKCCGNLSSDCQSSRDCLEGLCTAA